MIAVGQLNSVSQALRRLAQAIDEIDGATFRHAGIAEPATTDGTRVALVFDTALRQARTWAVIHSQYPITSDFDRGYDKGRKDAADAIDALRKRGIGAIAHDLDRETRQSVLVDAGLTAGESDAPELQPAAWVDPRDIEIAARLGQAEDCNISGIKVHGLVPLYTRSATGSLA
ncbi:MAG: hypothetical protein EPN79_10740 [Burkholderiaceae bacterium]|nr:MAG: hypothetical protein EPN79_10740 [Burkholderiaceae bacterium]TBR76836.1 MAG: hypothetical protein EPN64_06335 [Burkholderiaceae bacterium]